MLRERDLDARLPTSEEIHQTRQLISIALNGVQADQRAEIDKEIGSLIEEYDPFGQAGRKLISIRLPDDPSKPRSAWTYPTADVEREIERLFSGKQISAPPEMQFYVTDESDILFRFRNLISSIPSE